MGERGARLDGVSINEVSRGIEPERGAGQGRTETIMQVAVQRVAFALAGFHGLSACVPQVIDEGALAQDHTDERGNHFERPAVSRVEGPFARPQRDLHQPPVLPCGR